MKKIVLFSICIMLSLGVQAQLYGNWQILGPIPFPTDDVGQINGIGRVSQIKFHPSLSNKMYAVSASGGLFVSTNAATTWSPTGTDKYYFGSCASVAVDFTNDNVLYLGTGDANYYGSGTGVWKSTDGGSTWTSSNSGMGNRLVVEMLLLPTNNQVIIAATNNGIYRSTNAGATWTLTSASAIPFQDMVFKPGSNGQTIYATARQAYYRSTDAGVTWTQIVSPAFVFGGTGTRVDVSNANANVVYVANLGAGQVGEIYKSTDGGSTFTSMRTETVNTLCCYTYNNANGWGGQGNYNFDIGVDPSNANNVYLCAHIIWNSTDGGATWTYKQSSWAYVLHTDQHHIIINPYDNTQLFNANDGGVWLSTDGGTTWATRSDGLSTTECYHSATSPIKKDMVSIGTQDNGELYYTAGVWHCNRGGDYTAKMGFDYSVNNRVYYINDVSGASNGLRRVLPLGGNQNVNYPFVPATGYYGNDTRLSFSSLTSTRAYLSQNDIYVSSNITTNPPTWNQVTYNNVQIWDVKGSPSNSATVFAVRSDNKIIRVDNAFTAPSVNVYTFPVSTATIGLVAPINNMANVVYATGGSKVYRSSDNGATWTNITANLPATNVLHIVHDIYSTDESVYVNMGYSVYYKNNTMSNWVNFSQNLPVLCKINELMIYNDGTSNSVLRAAFYGRGVWETVLYPFALPCELISFYGEREQNQTKVTWITADEINVQTFDVQKSSDGKKWETIASLPPHGGRVETSYDVMDNEPLVQVTYYRLLTKDIDGRISTSRIISVSPDDKIDLLLYPNPVVDYLNIHLKNIQQPDIQVEVYNYKGELLYNQAHQTTDVKINTTSFIPGYYIIKVISKEFSKTQGFLILK